jgi:hypothetical protein
LHYLLPLFFSGYSFDFFNGRWLDENAIFCHAV